jgi:predicted  nucleic acid-binding Zn-ribbon protein
MRVGFRQLYGCGFILLYAVLSSSCRESSSREAVAPPDFGSKKNVDHDLARRLAADTEFLNEIVRTLNVLSRAQAEAHLVSNEIREVPTMLSIDQKQLIRDRLERIAQELRARSQEISRLRAKRSRYSESAKTPARMIGEYEAMISNLQSLIDAKEEEINQTRQSLADSRTQQADLQGELRLCQERNDSLASDRVYEQERWQHETETLQWENARLRTQAEEGFVAIGSEKELQAKGLIHVRRVGFLKSARVIEVARDLDPSRFTKINTLSTNPISLGAGKDFEILTSHRKGCYDPPSSHLNEVVLNINDIPCFWENKFLIVLKE